MTSVTPRKGPLRYASELALPTKWAPSILMGVDGRTTAGRRLRARYRELVDQVGPDAIDGSLRLQRVISALLRREVLEIGFDHKLLRGAGGRRTVDVVTEHERRTAALERELAAACRVAVRDRLRVRLTAVADRAA